MSFVVGIVNHTAGTTRFLNIADGYPCDVDRLENAFVFPSQEEAEHTIDWIMNSPNIELSKGIRLDPAITNITNLVHGEENDIELCVCRLSISVVSSYRAKVTETAEPKVQLEKQ